MLLKVFLNSTWGFTVAPRTPSRVRVTTLGILTVLPPFEISHAMELQLGSFPWGLQTKPDCN